MISEKGVFPAHIRKRGDGTYEIQTVREHCINTAQFAKQAVDNIGLGNTAYLAGLLHDLGKEKEEFKEYIEHAVEADERNGKTVNHSFAGARYILDEYYGKT